MACKDDEDSNYEVNYYPAPDYSLGWYPVQVGNYWHMWDRNWAYYDNTPDSLMPYEYKYRVEIVNVVWPGDSLKWMDNSNYLGHGLSYDSLSPSDSLILVQYRTEFIDGGPWYFFEGLSYDSMRVYEIIWGLNPQKDPLQVNNWIYEPVLVFDFSKEVGEMITSGSSILNITKTKTVVEKSDVHVTYKADDFEFTVIKGLGLIDNRSYPYLKVFLSINTGLPPGLEIARFWRIKINGTEYNYTVPYDPGPG